MLLLRYWHDRQLVAGRSIVKHFLRTCTSGKVQETVTQKTKENEDLKSKVFPDHSIIYMFPGIRYISFFNTTKTISTGFTATGWATVGSLYAANVLTEEIAVTTGMSLLLVTIWFHLAGLTLFNNFIGCIYTKENDDNAVISYVNYWGFRKNLVVDIANIIPLEEVPKNFASMAYRKLHIVTGINDKVFKLKMHFGRGVAIKETELKSIVGSWY